MVTHVTVILSRRVNESIIKYTQGAMCFLYVKEPSFSKMGHSS